MNGNLASAEISLGIRNEQSNGPGREITAEGAQIRIWPSVTDTWRSGAGVSNCLFIAELEVGPAAINSQLGYLQGSGEIEPVS